MSDSTLYLYTSLTAGSSHIVTATARLETILKANKLPFKALDVATDDAARKLWGRRSKGKKLPGLVKFGSVVGDLEEIEEWNEFGELRMQVNSVEDMDSFSAPAAGGGGAAAEAPTPTPTPTTTAPAPTPARETPPPKQSTIKIQSPPSKETKDDSIAVAVRQAGEQAASKAKNGNENTTTTTTSKPESNSERPQEAVKAEQRESEPEPEPEQAGGAEKHTEEQEQEQAQKQEEKKDENKTQDPKNVGPRPRRKSATPAPEIAGNGVQRPPFATVPEGAAESTENFQADNAEALGLVEHHRGSIVSATSDEERSQVARDLRQSVSEARADAVGAQKSELEDGDGGAMDGCILASECR
ncbi:hypothetical protein PHISP_06700 [Aspergillus sp. HF37]|nr:hypothetical protein PHISP_06700 [Aspergillus sp. HF37]